MWNVLECMTHKLDHSILYSKTYNADGTEWNQVISLPRHLAYNKENSGSGRQFLYDLNPLLIEPVEELKSLRFNTTKRENLTIPANGEKLLTGINGRAMELEVVIDPQKAREVGLRVLRSPDGREQTSISLLNAQHWPWGEVKYELMLDVTESSLRPDVASRTPEIGPLFLNKGELLRLRVFIDRSIVEVFANGRQALLLRAYPSRKDSTGISLFARGSQAKLVSLSAYHMRSIWPELKNQEGK